MSPGIVGVQSARVLGELDGDDGEEETWDGLGWMVHVAVLS